MRKTKVMIISTVGLIYDGITSVILSYLRVMDLSNIDIYIAGTIKVEPTIKMELETLGCSIVDLPSRREKPALYFLALTAFLRQNNVDIIHAHGNSATLAIELMAGLLGGCKKRIAHSHNTRCDQIYIDKILRPLFYHLYTDALACGQDAGEWMFAGNSFTIIKNGRDFKQFTFNREIRDEMRARYGIKDELVIGHVGGFVEQKNHRFLLDVYREIHKIEPTAKLFLIGDGVLRKEIERLASDLEEVLIFTSNVDNVPDYLQMMDGMLLPSLFEGFPLVVVEWQINGIPALVSDTIDRACAITDLVKFMSLQEPASTWAKEMLRWCNRRAAVSEVDLDSVRKAGFDIRKEVDKLERLYR